MRILVISVQLDSAEARLFSSLTDCIFGLVHEHPNFFDAGGHFLDYLSHAVWINPPRTLLVEYEPNRVSASINRRERIFEIRNTADFDPGHKISRRLSVVGRPQNLPWFNRAGKGTTFRRGDHPGTRNCFSFAAIIGERFSPSIEGQ